MIKIYGLGQYWYYLPQTLGQLVTPKKRRIIELRHVKNNQVKGIAEFIELGAELVSITICNFCFLPHQSVHANATYGTMIRFGKAVKDSECITKVRLESVNVPAEAVALMVESNEVLEYLDISSCIHITKYMLGSVDIEAQGMKLISDALKHNKVLLELNLCTLHNTIIIGNCGLSDDGIEALCVALSGNHSITHLGIGINTLYQHKVEIKLEYPGQKLSPRSQQRTSLLPHQTSVPYFLQPIQEQQQVVMSQETKEPG
eukprot:TRINITY_DN2485_c0_g1_i1.p1 TRINITY_DN2485_c0_g1~~TRINITY_DN2485_c0_g1_i1.p1  ORF type:complete len:279 (-),score=-11.09 TRINITY_DN2485_c0_g1_i1:824-1600(-)